MSEWGEDILSRFGPKRTAEEGDDLGAESVLRRFGAAPASNVMWKKAGESLLEANAPNYADARERFESQMSRVTDPDIERQIRETAKGPLDRFRALQKARNRAANRLEDEEPELAKRLRDYQSPSGPPAPDALSGIGGVAGAVGDALDIPGRYVARPLLRGVFGTSKERTGGDYSFPEFMAGVRATAEKDPGWRGGLAKAALAPAEPIGKTLGTAIAVPLAAVGAVSDVPGVAKKMEQPGMGPLERFGSKAAALASIAQGFVPESSQNIRETTKNIQRDVADMAFGAYTDPLALIPAGTGSKAIAKGARAVSPALESAGCRRLRPEYARGKELVRQARGEAAVAEAGAMSELQDAIRSLPPGTRVDERKIREAIRKRHQDPGFEVVQPAEQIDMFPPNEVTLRPKVDITLEDVRPGSKTEGQVRADMRTRVARQGEMFDPDLGEPGFPAEIRARMTRDWGQELGPGPEKKAAPIPEFGRERQYYTDETGATRAAVARPDYVPAEKLDETFGPGAKEYVDRVKDWHQKRLGELVGSGALEPGQAAYNPLSKQYMHRPIESVYGGLEEIAEKRMRSDRPSLLQSRIDLSGVKAGRSPDELPKYAREAEGDFAKIAPAYARQAARAQAQARLEQRIAQEFGRDPTPGAGSNLKKGWVLVQTEAGPKEIPADIYNLTKGTFDRSLSTMRKGLQRLGVGTTLLGRGVLKGLDIGTWADNRFKQMVLRTGGYLALNATDDSMRSVLSGNHALPIYLNRASRIISGVEVGAPPKIKLGGQVVSGADILREAQMQNIAVNAGARLEIEDTKAGARALKEAARAASGKGPSFGATYRKWVFAELGGTDRISEAANGWENRMKLAHYLWRRDQGDTPAQAAKHTLDTLIDYTDRNKIEQGLGWVIPFLKFAWKSPQIAAKTTIDHPAAVGNLYRGLGVLQGEQELEAPEAMRERGYVLKLPKRGREAVGGIRQIFGGSPAKEGTEMAVLPRLSQTDAYQPASEFFKGNLRPLGQMFGPIPKALIEAAMGVDLFTKKPQEPPGLTSLFPMGTPYVPTSMQANANQASWAKYLAPYLMSPIGLTDLNQLINEAQGGQGAIATFGSQRPYTSRQSPRDVFAHTYMSQLLGLRPYEVTPADWLRNRAYADETTAASSNVEAARKQEREERKGRR